MRLLFFFFVLLMIVFESVALATGQIVLASWYGGSQALEGKLMSNGQPFRSHDKTIAAHKTLRFGTKLLVTNPDNGRRLVVIVKDRGKLPNGRKLDLSLAAARELGYVEKGVTRLSMNIMRE